MQHEKPVLLVDMDGVLCDWYARILERLQGTYPFAPRIPHELITEFYVDKCYPDEWKETVASLSDAPNFYNSIPPIEGAVAAMKEVQALVESGDIDAFVLTAPSLTSDNFCCHSEKIQWVDKHLGSFWTKRVVISKDKTLVRGHLLIDDKPEITGVMTPSWTQILYTQPYNSSVQGQHFTWKDWPKLKDSLLGKSPAFTPKHKKV